MGPIHGSAPCSTPARPLVGMIGVVLLGGLGVRFRAITPPLVVLVTGIRMGR